MFRREYSNYVLLYGDSLVSIFFHNLRSVLIHTSTSHFLCKCCYWIHATDGFISNPFSLLIFQRINNFLYTQMGGTNKLAKTSIPPNTVFVLGRSSPT